MKKAIVLLVAVTMLSPALGLAGEGRTAGGGADEATTVKSGKSNADNRVGAGVGSTPSAGGPKTGQDTGSERGTTVKSGKSNTSE
ncbi:MAG TPA: hypothetical protein VL049_12255 [Candidatus Dormibacteraeota bacterium]|nr:hypothetical protein [Candidatus Dormibacteraeota bacterium]